MSNRLLTIKTLTPTATADTTDLVDNTYHGFIQGGNATQRVVVKEVYLGGQAPSTSSPCIMLLARSSQVSTGSATFGAGGTDAAVDGSATPPATLARVGNQAATLKPRRDTALCLWNLSVNAFGGELKYVPPAGGDVSIVGNTASLGEASLSAFSGGAPGLLGTTITYEIL
jgi:hypothetical protein